VKSKKVYLLQMSGLLALLALAGCMTAVKNQDSSVIQARAFERWNFLIEHHAEKAWDYLSPGFRETKPREAYATEMNARGVNWTKVSFNSQKCDADVCKVHLAVDYTVNMGRQSEKWPPWVRLLRLGSRSRANGITCPSSSSLPD